MTKSLSVLILATVFLFAIAAMAHEKVVVIPLGGSNDSSVPTVASATGRIWMDRNLGASQVATSPTDGAAYGDLYQWGRSSDGHERLVSATTPILSDTDAPGHGRFILTTIASADDWRFPHNDNLWQGGAGINNPCPSGFRLPTEAEFVAEMDTWNSKDSAGAFGSPLKLVMAGYRHFFDGSFGATGTAGYYWLSTVIGTNSRLLYLRSGLATIYDDPRSIGYSVRCIKN